jgi:hypothetical protein
MMLPAVQPHSSWTGPNPFSARKTKSTKSTIKNRPARTSKISNNETGQAGGRQSARVVCEQEPPGNRPSFSEYGPCAHLNRIYKFDGDPAR